MHTPREGNENFAKAINSISRCSERFYLSLLKGSVQFRSGNNQEGGEARAKRMLRRTQGGRISHPFETSFPREDPLDEMSR